MSNSTLAILGIITASLILVSQIFAKSPATTPPSYSALSTTENQSGGRKRMTKRRLASHNKSKRK